MTKPEEYSPLRDEGLSAMAARAYAETMNSKDPRTRRSIAVVSPEVVALIATSISAEEAGRELTIVQNLQLGHHVRAIVDTQPADQQDI